MGAEALAELLVEGRVGDEPPPLDGRLDGLDDRVAPEPGGQHRGGFGVDLGAHRERVSTSSRGARALRRDRWPAQMLADR
jgi:hypothetical protein